MTNVQRPENNIDNVAYWKKAHADAEAALTASRDRVFELEVQNRDLRENMQDRVNLSTENPSQKKRKRNATESVSSRSERAQEHTRAAERSTLASKLEAKTSLIMEELEVLISTRIGNVHNEHSTTHLLIDLSANSQMRHLRTLQQLIARRTLNPEELASTLVQMTSVIGQALRESKFILLPEPVKATTSIVNVTRGQVNKATKLQSKAIEDHEILLQIVYRTFFYILKGLDKLAIDAEGSQLQGQVIYDIVKFFRESLDINATYDGLGQPKEAPKRNSARSKEAVPTKSYAPYPDDSRLRIARLVVMIAASLNPDAAAPNNGAHRKIFEGFLYVLLERVRQVLRLFVFGNNECEETTSGGSGNNEQDEKLETAKASAPSLIWILERTIILIERNMQHSKRPDVGTRGADAETTLPPKNNQLLTANVKVNVAEGAKRRLQHTLLKGFFGGDDEDFIDALNEPKDPLLDLEREVAVVEEEDVTDWFKHEVERLVGWDVLTSCIAWDGDEAI